MAAVRPTIAVKEATSRYWRSGRARPSCPGSGFTGEAPWIRPLL